MEYTFTTMAEVKQAHSAGGGTFFDEFGSPTVHGEVKGGRFFITSEPEWLGYGEVFSICCIEIPSGAICSVGEFTSHSTLSLEDAEKELAKVVAEWTTQLC